MTRRVGPALPCPACRVAGRTCSRIGRNRTDCFLCNSFGQAVRRGILRRFKTLYPQEWERLRVLAELDIYPSVLEGFGRGSGDGSAQGTPH